MKLKTKKPRALPEANELLPYLRSWPDPRTVLPHLGPAQMMLMCGVNELGPQKAWVANLITWVEKEAKKSVNKGQVYGTAKSLVHLGCLRSVTVSHPLGAGRSVELYSITDYGEAVVQASLLIAKAISMGEQQHERWQEPATVDGRTSGNRQVRSPSRNN